MIFLNGAYDRKIKLASVGLGNDVYERFGGKLPRDKVANTEVLNLVGKKGWELLAVTHQPGPTMTFWFKRPAR